jgi:LmbE family N-acetylglucosaminyl deacetylase
MLRSLSIAFVACLRVFCADLTAIADNTSYNAGSQVRARLHPAATATALVRYSGEKAPVAIGIDLHGADYLPLWTIPWDARTGRYEVDLRTSEGVTITDAASFAVHRQFAKVTTVEFDKSFYTTGDSVNTRIVVRNLSNRRLDHLQLEFEPYTYPWITAAPDEPAPSKTVITSSLSLAPGEEKEFRTEKAAVAQAIKEPVFNYFSVVLRDAMHPTHIYDLATAPPAFTTPPGTPLPKQYPFLYLYPRLRDVSQSESYRNFYPPEFVSDMIAFDTRHTMFAVGAPLTFSYTVHVPRGGDAVLRARVLSSAGKDLQKPATPGPVDGTHTLKLDPIEPGLYTLEVSIESRDTTIASNRLEFAVSRLPKSILIFCAHQDDDTAHPGLIRAAVENAIPLHVVYFTSGDAGGCDRYYMHSCDAAHAMDFGEVRMEEARASLGHLGVAPENISFLGLPDGGLGQIWFEHPTPADPYLSVLLASDHAPYRDAAVPNLSFDLDSIVAATKQFIARYNPDTIVTGHLDERHIDHRVNNWIVVRAMQELLREGRISKETQLAVDVIYGAVPPPRAPYKYEKYVLQVSGEAAKLGQEASWYYQSQDGNHQQAAIVDYKKLPREEPYPHFRIVDWQEHQGWNTPAGYSMATQKNR